MESILGLSKEYAATEQFSRMSKSDVPKIRNKAGEMHSRLHRMSDKVKALMEEMEAEKAAIAGRLEEPQVELTQQEEWWKSPAGTSMFDHSVLGYWKASFRDRNPPKDISYATEIRRSMRMMNRPSPSRTRALDVKMFLANFDQETQHISRMRPGGYRAAFDIYLDTKLNILQPRDTTGWGSNSKRLIKQHEKIDVTLAEMLREYGTRPTDEAECYVDAGRACRDVWARMTANECGSYNDQPCVHDVLLQTLDTLQRRAYEEINFKVLTAVGSRLPADLTFMVFEYTMAAEKIPLDPRVYVHAKHPSDTRRLHVARLKCSQPISDDMSVLDEWKEDAEPWSHLDVMKRRENHGRFEFKGYGPRTWLGEDTDEDED